MARDYDLEIVGGPGKFDLMNALFKHGDKVTFRVRQLVAGATSPLPAQTVVASIISVEKEDESCESWKLSGRVEVFAGYTSVKFRAFYRTKYAAGQDAGGMVLRVS